MAQNHLHEFGILHEKFETAVGDYILGFATLERYLTWAIAAALRTDDPQARVIAVSIKSITARIHMFHSICNLRIKNRKQRARVARIAKALFAINGLRNHLVHDHWLSFSNPPSGPEASKGRDFAKGEFTMKATRLPLRDIEKGTRKIYRTIRPLGRLTVFLNNENQKWFKRVGKRLAQQSSP